MALNRSAIAVVIGVSLLGCARKNPATAEKDHTFDTPVVGENEATHAAPAVEEQQLTDPKEPALLRIFGDKAFYIARSEPEIVLLGVLRRSPVREGPNTRDMPFKLVTQNEELAVYTSGFQDDLLMPFVDREVKVVGKRIDQREEGFGFEVWVATIEAGK